MSNDTTRDEQRPLLNGHDDRGRYDGDSPATPNTFKTNTGQDMSHKDFVWIISGFWLLVFLGALDTTVVATLLTPIGSYFKKSNQATYVGTSYLLSVCCFTPLYGRLSDILGRKGALLLAISLFTTGTLLCGIANSMEMLVVARTIAGMGGGGVVTVANITLTDIIPLKQRGVYQGYMNIVFGVGAGLGGPLGGFLNDAFGWRSAFLLQIPFLVLVSAIVYSKVDIKLSSAVENETVKSKLKKIDFVGSATLVGAVATLLLAFSIKTTEELPWSSKPIVALFVSSAVLWASFVATEAYWSSHPVMPLRLVTQRTPAAVGLAGLFGSMTALSMIYSLPLYFSAVRLQSATQSGLHLLPNTGASGFGGLLAGYLMRRSGRYYFLILTFGTLALASNVALSTWGKETAQWRLWADVVGQGIGYTGFLNASLIAVIANVTKEDMAVATGITYLFRFTGQVLGVSLSGAALQAILLRKLRERITGPGSTDIIQRIMHDTEIIRTLDPAHQQAASDSYADGLRVVFIAQAACALLSLLSCSFIVEKPLPGTKAAEEEQQRRLRAREEDQ